MKLTPQMTSKGMFGNKEEVDDLKHLMGVYLGWGGIERRICFIWFKICRRQ